MLLRFSAKKVSSGEAGEVTEEIAGVVAGELGGAAEDGTIKGSGSAEEGVKVTGTGTVVVIGTVTEAEEGPETMEKAPPVECVVMSMIEENMDSV